jgi:hypothetical protein
MVLAALLAGLAERPRVILGIALLAFAAALTANFYCWQRYHEPFLLCYLPACFLLQQRRTERLSWTHLAPTLALALLFWAISASGFRGAAWPLDALPAEHHFAPGDAFLEGRSTETRGGRPPTANPAG